MTIADLFARIGLKTDEDKAKSFDKAMKNVKGTMIAVTAAAVGVSAIITKISADAMNSAVAFRQFQAETGASAETLQKWQAVAEQTNSSAESVTQAIKAIADNQQKIKLGQGNISGYQLLGIDPNQDPFEILEQLRSKTAGLSEGMRKTVLSQMGVGADLIQTLTLTNEQFDQMASNAFIISPQAINSLTQMKSSVDLAKRAIGFIKAQIATSFAPEVSRLTKKLQEFIKINQTGIVEGFKKSYRYVTLFVKAITNTAGMINKLVTSTVGWDKAIKGLIIIWGALNAVMLASPMGMVVAAIILLVAVLDDLYVYSKGGKSLFGVFMEKFPEMGEAILGVIDKIKTAFEIIKGVTSGDMTIQDAIDKWGAFGGVIATIINLIQTGMNVAFQDTKDILQKINDLMSGIKTFVSGGGFGDLAKEMGPVVNALYSGVTGEGGFFKDLAAGAREGFANSVVGNMLQNRQEAVKETAQNNNITINVTGSGDPEGVANKVMGLFNRQLSGASAGRGRDE